MHLAHLAACLTFAAMPLVLPGGSISTPAPEQTTGTFDVDPVHSHVGFHVLHIGISRVHGRFNAYSGQVVMDEDPTKSKVMVEIDAASIDTGSGNRDDHLKGPDFFNAVQHPVIRFESKQVKPDGEDRYLVEGELTLLGKTKPIEITVELLGTTDHPRFGFRAGFASTFTFERSDFGMAYGVENGMVGDEVTVVLSFETVRQ